MLHTLYKYLLCHAYNYTVLNDETVCAIYPNEAVDRSILEEVLKWMREGISLDDAVSRLRSRTVFPGYAVHPWRPGLLIISGVHTCIDD